MTQQHPRECGRGDDDDGILYGLRRYKVYLLTEQELDLLAWAPWWVRRRLIKRVKDETSFEGDHQPRPSEEEPNQ
jgi:hypothetical protein